MKQAVRNALNGRPKDEVHVDMSDSARDVWATRVNLGRASDQRDQDQADRGPNRLRSLTCGDEADSPTDENRRAVIDPPAEPKIESREPICSDERRIRSRQKDFPTRP